MRNKSDTHDCAPAPPLQFVAPDGSVAAELPAFTRNVQTLIELYSALVFTRAFDEKAVALQRTGRLGTYASSLGQEAVSVGVCSAMREDDVFLPSFREQGGQLWRGVTPLELLLYWGGDERGSDFAGPRQDFPVCIPVASHVPHAAGVAMAMQMRGEARAAVCIFGDGATSKGDFYEALNMAGVWKLPAVFVINNNQWAISVPREAQTAARTLAEKAVAAGIPGTRVDGNDVIAVKHATGLALDRARAGGGPALIECTTYRLGDHTTADDASRYRSGDEVSAHWHLEPVSRLRQYLMAESLWDKLHEERLLIDASKRIEEAVIEFLTSTAQPACALFDHLYATLPAELEAQRAQAMRGDRQAHDDA
ncbi:MAG: pyruvate dehydrogenase (acetyl-transferring) E1 component subunit alpha [Gammaproteobacteria bacterium]